MPDDDGDDEIRVLIHLFWSGWARSAKTDRRELRHVRCVGIAGVWVGRGEVGLTSKTLAGDISNAFPH